MNIVQQGLVFPNVPENVIPATISRTETDEDEDEDERKQNERYSLNPTMAPLVRQAQ
jgi:hypothetical protein